MKQNENYIHFYARFRQTEMGLGFSITEEKDVIPTLDYSCSMNIPEELLPKRTSVFAGRPVQTTEEIIAEVKRSIQSMAEYVGKLERGEITR